MMHRFTFLIHLTSILVFYLFNTIEVSANELKETPLIALEHDITPINSAFNEESYCIGINIGKKLKQQEINLSFKDLSLGIIDTLYDNELKTSEENLKSVLNKLKQNQIVLLESRKEKNKVEIQSKNEDFFSKNKEKKGVVSLSSGLQYKVLKNGKGKFPRLSDNVTFHYTGYLLDGREFDSSCRQKTPLTLPINNIITGLQEALQLMQPGAKWKIFVPSNLAYDDLKIGNFIEPYSALIFDIEIFTIEKNIK